MASRSVGPINLKSQPETPTKPSALRRLPFFYGWVIVFVAFITVFFSGPGQTYSISMFIEEFINEFGWSRSFISGLYATGTLIAGLTMTFIGRMTERIGHRRMLVAVALLLGLSTLWMSFVQLPWMILIGFIGLRIFGQGSMTLIPNSLVPQWFVTKRGRALSFVALGSMVGSAVIPLFNLQIIEIWGWRATWQVWAVLLAAVMAPIAYFLVRERPEDLGLLPDNAQKQDQGSLASTKLHTEVSFTLKEAMRTRVFWIVLAATTLPPMIMTGLTFHHLSIMEINGIGSNVAASVFTVAALAAFPCTFLAGYMGDRWPVRYLLVASMVGHAVSIIYVLWTNSPLSAITLGILRGADQGLFAIINGVIWPEYFGREHLPSLRGMATTAMVVGSSLGPIIVGAAYDMIGSYTQVIVLMAILPLIAGAAVMVTPEPTGSNSG